MPDGFPVVLTADRILTADYPLLLDGMAAASLTTTTPRWLFDRLMAPQLPPEGVRAPLAPLGLRRVEAALRSGGFTETEVAVVAEAQLAAAIGPATRVVGISTGDPCGLGMNSTTMAAIMGGRPWTERGFRRLLASVRQLIAARAPMARVVVGGPGAWQIAGGLAGVDLVVGGYCEAGIAAQVRALCDGAAPGPVRAPAVADIPLLHGASTMGAVELSRGCGYGCAYCTMAAEPMRHLAPERIVADAELNLGAGRRHLTLLSEDVLRYGGSPAAALGLLARLRALPGVGLLQVDHANLTSVARWSDGELAAAVRLLGGPAETTPWINVGVESVDGAQVNAAKRGGVEPAAWAGHAAEQVRRLVTAGFFPFVSLLLALPDEPPASVAAMQRWSEALFDDPALGGRLGIFPLFHAPVDGRPPVPPTRAHWRLLDACWRRNFPRMAQLYGEQQRAVGVGRGRRALIQALGFVQRLQWRGLLAWRAWRAA